MKRESRTVDQSHQVAPTLRHLPLVDLAGRHPRRADGARGHLGPEGSDNDAGRGSHRDLRSSVPAPDGPNGGSGGHGAERGRARRPERWRFVDRGSAATAPKSRCRRFS